MDEWAQTIIAIADSGTISKAARELHISQPALSLRLQQIERDMGATLFNRTCTPLVLTDAGKILLESARKIIEMEDSAARRISELASHSKRQLRVGVSTQRATMTFPDIIEEFYQLNDECTLCIEEHPCPTLDSLLLDRLVDITVGAPNRNQDRVVNVPLAREYIVLAIPSSWSIATDGSQVAGLPVFDFSSLVMRPSIMPPESRNFGRVFRELYAEAGAQPDIIMSCRSTELALTMVSRGMGMTLCTSGFMGNYRNVTFGLVREHLAMQSYAVSYRRGWQLTPDARLFIGLLEKHIRQFDRTAEADSEKSGEACTALPTSA
jgi:DNA-binding transcriptional LysR family regulator